MALEILDRIFSTFKAYIQNVTINMKGKEDIKGYHPISNNINNGQMKVNIIRQNYYTIQ